MPGIAGLFAHAPSAAHEATVRRMLATMRHRPASACGTHFAPELGVYAGWVAHEASFAARQSQGADRDGTMLAFCGECHPATELLEAYRTQGDAFLETLNGLFSGLLIDPVARHAVLFNDRYGSERIYVAEDDGAIFFASEAKALLRVLERLRAFDERGLAQFLACGSTRGEQTLFRGVRLLPGGSSWVHEPGRALRRGRYFSAQCWEQHAPLSDDAFDERFAETFARVLPRYLDAVPRVGVSLTGGLDTRMIAACLPCADRPAVAYTYAAEDADTLDVRIAREVAGRIGIAHHVLRIGKDFVADFAAQVDRTVFVTDGCAGATGAHELYLSERAHRLAPVRLTGNYGSEVLRSVSTLRPLQLADTMVADDFRNALRDEASSAGAAHSVTRAAFEEIPWHLFGSLAAARSQLTFRTPYLDNELVELAFRAPARRRRVAGPALKLIHRRAPELAAIATDRGLAWPPNSSRSLARRLFCEATFKLDYWHKEGLPDALAWVDPWWQSLARLRLLGLHKFLPYRGWFRRELSAHVREVVHDARMSRLGFLDAGALRVLVDEHASGRRNRTAEINAALTLEAIDRLLLRGSP